MILTKSTGCCWMFGYGKLRGIDPSVTDLQEATAIITREADLDLPARMAYVNYLRVTSLMSGHLQSQLSDRQCSSGSHELTVPLQMTGITLKNNVAIRVVGTKAFIERFLTNYLKFLILLNLRLLIQIITKLRVLNTIINILLTQITINYTKSQHNYCTALYYCARLSTSKLSAHNVSSIYFTKLIQ